MPIQQVRPPESRPGRVHQGARPARLGPRAPAPMPGAGAGAADDARRSTADVPGSTTGTNARVRRAAGCQPDYPSHGGQRRRPLAEPACPLAWRLASAGSRELLLCSCRWARRHAGCLSAAQARSFAGEAGPASFQPAWLGKHTQHFVEQQGMAKTFLQGVGGASGLSGRPAIAAMQAAAREATKPGPRPVEIEVPREPVAGLTGSFGPLFPFLGKHPGAALVMEIGLVQAMLKVRSAASPRLRVIGMLGPGRGRSRGVLTPPAL